MTNLLRMFAIVSGALTAAAPAQAYLDPGTGSMILQVLLGGIAGVAVVLKLYWNKIKAFFGGTPAGDGETENEHIPE